MAIQSRVSLNSRLAAERVAKGVGTRLRGTMSAMTVQATSRSPKKPAR